MGSKVTVTCEGCGITGTIEFPASMTLNTGAITCEQPCPKCGGKFSAPGGKYETDENGVLQRVGDYQA